MRILDLAFKDLSQIIRDRRSLIFLAAMPIVFTLFMGFAYKNGTNSAPQDQRIALGWVNNDPEGLLTDQLHTSLAGSSALNLVDLPAQGADEALRKGEVAGVLLVPEGFSASLNGDAAAVAQLKLLADPASAQGQSLYQLLRAPVAQLMSSVEVAHLSAEAAGQPGSSAELTAAFQAASQAWAQTDSAALVQVEALSAPQKPAWYGDNPYNQASPGILVQFAIFGLVSSGQILVQERKSRTLQRMLNTSLHPWEIVAGHTLAMFAVVFFQEALLIVFGQLALGVDYASQPLAILAVSTGLGLWIAATGLLIGVVVKDDSQVTLVSLMGMFVFCAMGGIWFPLEASSGAFAAVGKLLPSAWAMDGFQNILIRGLGLGSVALAAAILLAYALAFFALAVWRFRKMSL